MVAGARPEFDCKGVTSTPAENGKGAFVVTLPSHTFTGGFIGGGTEVAVTAIRGPYWRSEYRLASYRSADLPLSFDGVPENEFNHESKSVQTITTSLVWKFH
jgi:hypothetical protein